MDWKRCSSMHGLDGETNCSTMMQQFRSRASDTSCITRLALVVVGLLAMAGALGVASTSPGRLLFVGHAAVFRLPVLLVLPDVTTALVRVPDRRRGVYCWDGWHWRSAGVRMQSHDCPVVQLRLRALGHTRDSPQKRGPARVALRVTTHAGRKGRGFVNLVQPDSRQPTRKSG